MDREAEEAMRDDRINRQKNNNPEIRSRRRRRNGGGGSAAWRDEGKVAGDKEVAGGENAMAVDTDQVGAGIENALPENGNTEDSAFELCSTANPTKPGTGHEPVCEAETQDEAADDEALGVNTPGDETYDGDETPVGSPSSQLPADYRIPPRKWFLTFMYMNIPVIGWIYLLVKAFGRKNTQLKDFARAYLLYKLVFLLVALIILGLAVYVGLGILDELLAYMEML